MKFWAKMREAMGLCKSKSRAKIRTVRMVCRSCSGRFRRQLAPKQSPHAFNRCPKCGRQSRMRQASL